jgi:DNA-binding response OmpR family regulator
MNIGRAENAAALAPCPLGLGTLLEMPAILVLADEPWVFDQVRSALADDRYSLTEADDPRSVAATVLEEGPDAVIVDLQVGSMGGMAVTRAVRDAFAIRNGTAPPVIMLLDRDADAFLAGRSGAAAWVRKPFGSAQLRKAIDEALDGK